MTDQQKNTVAGNSLNAVEREPVRLGSSIQKHAGRVQPVGGAFFHQNLFFESWLRECSSYGA